MPRQQQVRLSQTHTAPQPYRNLADTDASDAVTPTAAAAAERQPASHTAAPTHIESPTHKRSYRDAAAAAVRLSGSDSRCWSRRPASPIAATSDASDASDAVTPTTTATAADATCFSCR